MAIEYATLGGGRFWVTEAVYQQIRGIKSVQSGYMGGETAHPTYEEVCSGDTGHAEVVRIQYDSAVISYRHILDVYFTIYDPQCALPKQGKNTPHRSVIFTHNHEQKSLANEAIKRQERYSDHVIPTQVLQCAEFYPAEDEHQNYYRNNRLDSYSLEFIAPKISLSRALFKKTLAA